MTQEQIFDQIVGILRPFVKNVDGLNSVSMDTGILKDLKVNSARLVDVVLEMEDTFGIEVSDEEADKVRTVGDAVRLILARAS